MSPGRVEAETRLRTTLMQYRTADEGTRTSIEEHLSQLMDAGVPKPEIASTLGAMFAVESSAGVKCSILNELYYIDDPSVFEQVRLGLSPDQPLQVRDEAIYVLRDIGDNRAIPALWPYLSDPDINIREEAQEAIDAIMLRAGATAR
jgi:HEAT repeats